MVLVVAVCYLDHPKNWLIDWLLDWLKSVVLWLAYPSVTVTGMSDWETKIITRMVQLPATAAIEYVAACCRTRTRTRTKTGTKSKIGTITKTVRGAYARSPQVQCVYVPSRLSVPSIVAWRTNKDKKRQTRPRSSAGSWPPLPNFSGYVEVEAHYIFHPSTRWVRPLFTELGPKYPHFAIKANEYRPMSP